MATTTNYGWTTPDNTALVKDGAAAIRTLGSSADATVFANANAAIAKTIVDAKGDLIAATAADTVSRIGVGANGTLLSADSTAATGLAWVAAPSSGGMTLLSTTTLTGASVTVSSINQTFNSLYLVVFGVATGTTAVAALRVAPNGSTSISHSVQVMFSGYSTITSDRQDSYIFLSNYSGANKPKGNNTNNAYSAQINNYSSTTARKTFASEGIFVDDISSAPRTFMSAGGIDTTSAITSLTISTDSASALASGTLLIYGVK